MQIMQQEILRRRIAQRDRDREWTPSSHVCYFCNEDANNTQKGHRIQPGFTSCGASFHAECLLHSIVNGRSECPCGNETFDQDYGLHILVPAQAAFYDPPVEDNSSSSGSLSGVVNANDCAICLSGLQSPLVVGGTDCCSHQFHVHCLLRTAHIPAFEHDLYGHAPRFPCPLCRREICTIQVAGAPPVHVHYALLEHERHFGWANCSWEDFIRLRRQRQQQMSWSEYVMFGLAAVGGAIVIGSLILMRR